jgi:hypothetical protein
MGDSSSRPDQDRCSRWGTRISQRALTQQPHDAGSEIVSASAIRQQPRTRHLSPRHSSMPPGWRRSRRRMRAGWPPADLTNRSKARRACRQICLDPASRWQTGRPPAYRQRLERKRHRAKEHREKAENVGSPWSHALNLLCLKWHFTPRCAHLRLRLATGAYRNWGQGFGLAGVRGGLIAYRSARSRHQD